MNYLYYNLIKEIVKNINNYYCDNYDNQRFGEIKYTFKQYCIKKWNSFFFKIGFYQINENQLNDIINNIDYYCDHINSLEDLYNILQDEESKNLLVAIFAYKILGYTGYKLPLSRPEYWKKLEFIEKKLKREKKKYWVKNFNWYLSHYDLHDIGYPILLNCTAKNVLNVYLLEQYSYIRPECDLIEVNPGDIVIDGGSCWGDSALLFAFKAGSEGKVYSFEFVPNNINILHENVKNNPYAGRSIEIVERALWDTTDDELFINDFGPGSSLVYRKPDGDSFAVMTVTIDDFVKRKKIDKIDFIKLDIEGAELKALMGARKSILKFRPKLAISLYHSITDYYEIPYFINNLNIGYKFYLKHNTIHSEETVLFCI